MSLTTSIHTRTLRYGTESRDVRYSLVIFLIIAIVVVAIKLSVRSAALGSFILQE